VAAWNRAHGVHGQALFPLLATPGSGAAGAQPPVLGLLTFELTGARDVPDDEMRFLGALAGVTAQALERVRLTEAEQAARQAAEAASRAKSEFLAVMSHELRTPLNAIGGYTELIELGIRGPVTPEQRADLARIQQSQRHLLGLINQVLNYARVDAGAVEYQLRGRARRRRRSPRPRRSCCRRCRRAGSASAATRCPRGARRARRPREAAADPAQPAVQRVKFTDAGRARCAWSGAPRAPWVCLAVADTGVGIAPEKLATIFEPFVQVDQRLTRSHDGVGLGLAISRELARGMGGDLVAESTPGAGSTFTLVLPRARAA
jgi:signal transduction histidine kinase